MTKLKLILVSVFLACSISSVYAIAGLGVHYGLDLSLSMKDVTGEAAVFDNLKIPTTDVTGTLPAGFSATAITGKDLPIIVDRTGFASTPMDFGAKLYVDCIPFIDAVEVSGNLGLWEYKGKLIYPVSMAWAPTATVTAPAFTAVNDTLNLTLDSLGKSFMGLHQTPYAKLNVDLTIRKNIFTFPPLVKMLKVYAGGGLSVNFATPALSAGLIKDAVGTSLDTSVSLSGMNALFTGVQSKIMDQIITKLMTPHMGLNIVVGTMFKVPIIPLGLYIDGKFMIPFEKLDSSVDVGGTGLLVNAGVTLGL